MKAALIILACSIGVRFYSDTVAYFKADETEEYRGL